MNSSDNGFWQKLSNAKAQYQSLREEYGPAAHGINENARWATRALGNAWTRFDMDDRLSFGTLLGGIGAKSGHHITHFDLDTGLIAGGAIGLVLGKRAWDGAKKWAYDETPTSDEYSDALRSLNDNAKLVARTIGNGWSRFDMDDRLSFGTLLAGIGAKSGHHITHFDLDTGLLVGGALGLVFGKKAWDTGKEWAYGEAVNDNQGAAVQALQPQADQPQQRRL